MEWNAMTSNTDKLALNKAKEPVSKREINPWHVNVTSITN